MMGNQHLIGHVHSAETRARMSASHIGLTHTEESKKKMSEVKKGSVFSDEHRANLSAAAKAAWARRREAKLNDASGSPPSGSSTVEITDEPASN